MATEQATVEVKLKDFAGDGLVKLNKQIQDTRESGQELTGATEQATASVKGLGLVAGAGAAAVGVLAGAILAAGAGLVKLYEVTRIATEEADKYQFAEANLDAALRASTMSQEEATKAKARALTVSRELSKQTGVLETDIQGLIARNLSLGGSYEEAEQNASLALDIMARKGVELKDATEKLAKVRRGEVADLAELVDLTRSEQDALTKMTDTSARAQRMVAILNERFKGAKSEIQGTQVAVANLTNAKNALVAQIGRAVDESGVFGAVLGPVTDALYKQANGAKDAKTDLSLFALTIGGAVVKGVALAAKVLIGLVTTLRMVGVGFEMLAEVANLRNRLLVGFVQAAVAAILEQYQKLLSGIDTVVSGFEKFARLSGNETLIKSAALARKGLDGVTGAIKSGTKALEESRAANAKQANEAIKNLEDLSKKRDQIIKEGADTFVKVQDIELKALDNIAKRRVEVEKTRGQVAKVASNQETLRNKLRKEGAALDSKANVLAEAQLKVLRLQRAVITEKNEARKIGRQTELAQAELAVKLLGITNARVRAETELTERERIKAQEIERVNALLKARKEAAVKAAEAEKKAIADAIAEYDKTSTAISAAGAQLVAFEADGSRAIGALTKGLGGLAQAGADVHRAMKLSALGSEDAAKASAKAISTSGRAVAGFAQALGVSAADSAGIMALFETGAALASLAVGDFAGAALHTASAVQFGAVAAMGGKGNGASGGAGAGAAGGGSGGGGAALAQTTGNEAGIKRGAELFAEALAREMGGGTQAIYFNIEGSTILDERGFWGLIERHGRDNGVDLPALAQQAGF